ncbi:MAG TPA: glutamate--cysteine ligase, partial [Ancylobacter sp.]
VPRLGFKAQVAGRSMLDVARDVVAIARDGLKRRDMRDSQGRNEARFLDTLDESLSTGKTPADLLLERYHGAWGGSVDPVFTEDAY